MSFKFQPARRIAAICRNKPSRLRVGFAVSALAVSAVAAAHEDSDRHGIVYTETNAAVGNAILVFERASDGSLTLSSKVSTQGLGTEGGLGNQGALALDAERHLLFAINAGSDEISVLAESKGGLTFVDKVASGGTRPVSLTTAGNLLYVLNAGGSGNIAGFRVRANGHLEAIPGSTRALSSPSAGAAEIAFNHEGEVLAVTEKATGKIDLYTVDDGVPTGPKSVDSVGQTPFGFAFGRRDRLLVTEAFGGAANASALSSYSLNDDVPDLSVISPSVATHQSAACWVVLDKHGHYAYTTNTGSGSVSGYQVDRSGALKLLNPNGITALTGPGSGPTDAAVSGREEFLFVLTPPVGKITTFSMHSDGSLTTVGSVAGVPNTATGLVAR